MSGFIRFLEGAKTKPMRQAVAVAAKAPQPGRVKTRLVPDLTPEDRPILFICFLRDTFVLVESVPGANVVISYQPPTAESQMREPFGDRHPRYTTIPNGHELPPSNLI